MNDSWLVVLVLLICASTWGDPDLIDGIVFYLMN